MAAGCEKSSDSGDTQRPGNISWAAYHADKQTTQDTSITVTPTALLPLFHDQAHSVAMIRHAMDVVKAATNELNPGQIPVITLDQPLYAIAKQVQWNWPEHMVKIYSWPTHRDGSIEDSRRLAAG